MFAQTILHVYEFQSINDAAITHTDHADGHHPITKTHHYVIKEFYLLLWEYATGEKYE